MFTERDSEQINRHGLTVEKVERQIENFRRGFPSLRVVAAASPGDGITVLSPERLAGAERRYDAMRDSLSVVKFVPASGAATRMFKELFEFVNDGKRGKGIDQLVENIDKFAFYDELRGCVKDFSDDRAVVSAIIGEGLGYGSTPKGLVTFHRYPDGCRKAVEEHLVEGAQYAASNGVSRLHFTVSPEHMEAFRRLLAERVIERCPRWVLYVKPQMATAQEEQRGAGLHDVLDAHPHIELIEVEVPITLGNLDTWDLRYSVGITDEGEELTSAFMETILHASEPLEAGDAVIASWSGWTEPIRQLYRYRGIITAELANNGESHFHPDFYTRMPNFDAGVACADELLSRLDGKPVSARLLRLTNIVSPPALHGGYPQPAEAGIA